MDGFTLKVTPEELTSTAGEFQNTGSQVRNLTSQMLETVTGLLNSSWIGDAATAYINKFRQLDTDIERMHRMINEHVEDLQVISQEYTTAESGSAQESSGLPTQVIL